MCVFWSWQEALHAIGLLSGAKNATFCAIYTLKRSFYHDRLGTNIGKVETRVAFFLGRRSDKEAQSFVRQELDQEIFRENESLRSRHGAKNAPLFEPFLSQNDLFTKTGSGRLKHRKS